VLAQQNKLNKENRYIFLNDFVGVGPTSFLLFRSKQMFLIFSFKTKHDARGRIDMLRKIHDRLHTDHAPNTPWPRPSHTLTVVCLVGATTSASLLVIFPSIFFIKLTGPTASDAVQQAYGTRRIIVSDVCLYARWAELNIRSRRGSCRSSTAGLQGRV